MLDSQKGNRMKKIISLFQRNYEGDRLVRDEVVPGADWVISGEGIPTRKYDGTCCMIRNGQLFKRYDAKKGKNPPIGFVPAQEPDDKTGHWPGWLAVGDGPDDKWFREGLDNIWEWKSGPKKNLSEASDGTYELIGPKIQGNPENYTYHALIKHGMEELDFNHPDSPESLKKPITFERIKKYLSHAGIEGIVWHHPDGRMVKIKAKDFGFKRGTP